MKSLLPFALAALLAGTTRAQVNPFDSTVIQSISGQFFVVEPKSRPVLEDPFFARTNADDVVVDADRLAVGCERVRDALNHELGGNEPWQGKIHIFLHPATDPDEMITVVSERFPDGWNYRLDVPERVGRARLVRGIVSALLLEIANRRADTHSAELPVWLTEGLTQQLMAAANTELIPPAPRSNIGGVNSAPVDINRRMKDPLEGAFDQLRGHPALTLKDLSWPDDASLEGNAGALYRANAQLFVHELLQLPDGPASLRSMLAALPDCYNWQTAFFHAFGGDFPSQLDLEKWWALETVHFSAPNPNQFWSRDQTWQRLDEIVHASVEIRQSQADLPAEREADLRDVVRNLDYDGQKRILAEKVRELDAARPFCAPGLAELVEGYRTALAGYLDQRDQMSGTSFPSRGFNSTTGILVNNLLHALDLLETRRIALRPRPTMTNTAQAQF